MFSAHLFKIKIWNPDNSVKVITGIQTNNISNEFFNELWLINVTKVVVAVFRNHTNLEVLLSFQRISVSSVRT